MAAELTICSPRGCWSWDWEGDRAEGYHLLLQALLEVAWEGDPEAAAEGTWEWVQALAG